MFPRIKAGGEKWLFVLRVFFLLLSLAFLAYGIYRGELKVLFNKAVRICLECIGIG